jgi:hypothetical protein
MTETTTILNKRRCKTDGCNFVACTDHYGDPAVYCSNCSPHCGYDIPLLDNNHLYMHTKLSFAHSHHCKSCGVVFSHRHVLQGHALHELCDKCSPSAIPAVSRNWMTERMLIRILSCIVLVFFSVIICVTSYAVFLHFSKIGDSVGNLIGQTTTTFDQAVNITGHQVRKVIASASRDIDNVTDTVLFVAETAASFVSSAVTNETHLMKHEADALFSGVYGLQSASVHLIAKSMFVLYCLFSSTADCHDAFYTKFHLCTTQKTNFSENGILFEAIEPCKLNGADVVNDAVRNWFNHGWDIRMRSLSNIIYETSFNMTAEEQRAVVANYTLSNQMLPWAQHHSDLVCNKEKHTRARQHCFQSRCTSPYHTTQHEFVTCILSHAGLLDSSPKFAKSSHHRLLNSRHPNSDSFYAYGLSMAGERCHLDAKNKCPPQCELVEGLCFYKKDTFMH